MFTNKYLLKAAVAYLMMIIGQILSAYLAIVTVKSIAFSQINTESLSIYIDRPIIYYTFVLLFWNIFSGFLLLEILSPVIIFFKGYLPKLIWIILAFGQFYLVKDVSYVFFSTSKILNVIHLCPAILSFFLAIYFQSRRT